MNYGKGLIGIVSSDRNTFSWSFIQSLIELKTVLGVPISYSQVGTIDAARNQILLTALKHDCDWVVMLDSDMVVPRDGVLRLLETMKKEDAEIGAGLYFKGSRPYDAVAFDYDGEHYVPITDWSETRYVDAVGMGFTVIKKSLFHLSFGFVRHKDRMLGEDVKFCHDAREGGTKIVLDPSVRCGHLRMIEIDEQYIKLHENTLSKA